MRDDRGAAVGYLSCHMNGRLQSLISVITLASSCVAWAQPPFPPFSSDARMTVVTQCERGYDAALTNGKTVRFRGLSSTAPATRPSPATQASAGTRVDVATFRKLAVNGGEKVAILDVRTPQEFAQGHLAGAMNIDSSAPDFEQKLAALDRDKTYLVYCRVGEGGREDREVNARNRVERGNTDSGNSVRVIQKVSSRAKRGISASLRVRDPSLRPG